MSKGSRESRRKDHRPTKKRPSKIPRLANLTILIELPDSKTARSVQSSVEPETKAGKAFRSTTTVSSQGKRLRIEIEAGDLVALRAASNSFLHFVAVALRGVSVIAPFYRAIRKPNQTGTGPKF